MQKRPSRTAPTIPATHAAEPRGADPARLPKQLSAIVARIDAGPDREALADAFRALAALLDELDALDVNSFHQDSAFFFASAFRALRLDALDLADRADEAAPALANEELAGALAGLSFAVRHEMRRAFELDLGGLEEPQPAAVARGRVAHAHGLLQNCFQQCVVLLARVYEPRLDEMSLFDDGPVRLRQSVALRDALASLIGAVAEAGGRHYPFAATELADEVERFRRESMCLLMRRDWETFEGFAKEIAAARNRAAFSAARIKFSAYLETLLSHVEMRAVLRHAHSTRPRPATRAAAAPVFA